MFCENCGHAITHPWPVEPIFTLDVAAMMLGMKLKTLESWLTRHWRHEDRRYKLIVAEGRRRATKHRVLTASEVRIIYSRTVYKAKGKTDA